MRRRRGGRRTVVSGAGGAGRGATGVNHVPSMSAVSNSLTRTPPPLHARTHSLSQVATYNGSILRSTAARLPCRVCYLLHEYVRPRGGRLGRVLREVHHGFRRIMRERVQLHTRLLSNL
jgi:hypothetical protein